MEYLDWAEAKAAADKLDLVVCATFRPDGTPVYFVEAPDVDEDTVHAAAFERRHGRPMSGAEDFYLKLGKTLA